MKITDVSVHLVRLPSRREHLWASKMETPIGHHAIVELHTDEGMVGWGEAPAGGTWGGAHGRHYGETPETVQHIVVGHLLPAIRGLDPLDLGVIHDRMDRVVRATPTRKPRSTSRATTPLVRHSASPSTSFSGGCIATA